MTTVDITLANGRSQDREHNFILSEYFKLELNKLLIIKSLIEGLGTDEWLKNIENGRSNDTN